MEHVSMQVAMYVIYAYVIWYVAELLWDWHKNRRRRSPERRRKRGNPTDATHEARTAGINHGNQPHAA
jgi:hypothetical protein